MITSKELKETFDYNEETGIFTWKVKPNKNISKGQAAGGMNSDGYICITVNGKKYQAHRLAWLYVYGVWPTALLDHEDQIKHHNWVGNLREASQAQNQQNVGKRVDNTSGHKGVSFHKKTKKWSAQIHHQGKKIHLGLFPTTELAHEAYLAAQATHHTHRPTSSDPL